MSAIMNALMSTARGLLANSKCLKFSDLVDLCACKSPQGNLSFQHRRHEIANLRGHTPFELHQFQLGTVQLAQQPSVGTANLLRLAQVPVTLG